MNVTPNRPDALSHAGIAREVAALFETSWRLPPVDSAAQIALPQGRGVDVEIRDPAACPRYAARVITGVKVGPSPLPMRVRLAACGIRAISNLVDVTNYVMLETGHPLHAFDLDRLRGGIVQARRANRGEKIKTLDGIDRPLQEGDVVIADGQGAIALAGVMGGAESEVSATTTAVLLETATFDPRAVRRTAKRLGLHSEASHRFERGVDAEGVPHASRRAAAMMARLGGGAVAGEGIDRYPQQQHPRRVTLSAAGLTRLAGFEIPLAQAAEKLAAIGIASAPDGADKIAATVPTFRPGRHDRRGSRRGGHAPRRLRSRAGAVAARKRRAGPQPRGAGRSGPRRAGRHRPHRDRQLGLRPAPLAGGAGERRSPTASR